MKSRIHFMVSRALCISFINILCIFWVNCISLENFHLKLTVLMAFLQPSLFSSGETALQTNYSEPIISALVLLIF